MPLLRRHRRRDSSDALLRREAEGALRHIRTARAQFHSEELVLGLIVVLLPRRGFRVRGGQLVQGGDAVARSGPLLGEEGAGGVLGHGAAGGGGGGAVEDGEGGYG